MSLEKAIAKFKAGELVIITDHHTRENEGDLVLSSQLATAQNINFMTKYGRGLVCVTITESRAKELELIEQPKRNNNAISCAFTVSVDASCLSTSGISVKDRTKTINTLADINAKADDLATPGHVFPVVAVAGGLKARDGHTEASIELCLRAGLYPSAVICEILAEDGSAASGTEIAELAVKFDIPVVSIADLLATMGETYE